MTIQPATSVLGVRRGAEQIADFLFGDARQRRRVYHLCEAGKLPHFKLGAVICARESTLLTWIEEQERQSIKVEAA